MKSLQCHSISPKSILKSHSPEVCYIFSMVFYILYKHGDMSICMHTWYIFSHKIRIIPCLMVFMVSCFFLIYPIHLTILIHIDLSSFFPFHFLVKIQKHVETCTIIYANKYMHSEHPDIHYSGWEKEHCQDVGNPISALWNGCNFYVYPFIHWTIHLSTDT